MEQSSSVVRTEMSSYLKKKTHINTDGMRMTLVNIFPLELYENVQVTLQWQHQSTLH